MREGKLFAWIGDYDELRVHDRLMVFSTSEELGYPTRIFMTSMCLWYAMDVNTSRGLSPEAPAHLFVTTRVKVEAILDHEIWCARTFVEDEKYA